MKLGCARGIRYAGLLIAVMSCMAFCETDTAPSRAPRVKVYKDGYIYMPEDGFVPSSTAAIAVAEAIWLPLYGQSIYDSKPFVARLEGDSVWVVEGTLSKGTFGGVPYAEIEKTDCRVIRVTHTE